MTYSVENFKLILKALNLKEADFAKLTRGIIQSDGKFKKNDITPQQFYQEWFNIIKNDLNPPNPPSPLVFGEHKSLKSVTFTGSSDQIAMIDAALQDVFGYPAFVLLLGGVMTFSEDSTQSFGYRIDFVKHSQQEQSTLLKDFLGRALHDTFPRDIGDKYLSGSIRGFTRRAFYWTETLLFGFRRGNSIINPPTTYFTDNYYDDFDPALVSDYSFATQEFLKRYFTEYNSVSKTRQKHFDGRLEIFDLMFPKARESFEKERERIDPSIYHSGSERIFINQLMKNIDFPDQTAHDFVTKLKMLGTANSNERFVLGRSTEEAWGGTWVAFEMTRNNDLIPAISNSKLTLDTFKTWRESNYAILNREESDYFLDFDIALNSGLDQDLIDAYRKIKEMFDMVPESDSLKIELYARGKNGIDRFNTINRKLNSENILVRPDYIDTDFRFHEIEVNRENPAKAIISLLLWMMLEPNIFSVVKWGNRNFIYSDIFDLYDQSHIQSGSIDSANRIEGSFVWIDGAGGTFTPEAYKQFADAFSRIFMPRDIRYFLGFHNHETDNRFNNIIDYIKYKVKVLFKNRGVLHDDLLDLR